MKNKKDFINIAKGICILLVILEHSLLKIDFIGKIILMFHMPFFFFISGFCFKYKNNKLENKEYIKKTIIKNLKIYILFSIIGILWYIIKNVISHKEINLLNIFINFIYCNQTKVNIISGVMWFIITLLICKIIFNYIYKYIKKLNIKKHILLLIILYCFAIILNILKVDFMPYCLDNVRFAIIFYYIGFLSNKYNIIKKIKDKKYINCLLLFTLLITTTYLNKTNIMMYENNYGNYLLFIIGSLSGIYLLITTSNTKKRNIIIKKLEKLGNNTLYFFTFQFIVLDIVKTIIITYPIKLNNNILFNSTNSTFVFIITIIILIPIDFLSKKIISKYYLK